MMCPSFVYASDHGGSGGTDHNSAFITDSGTINVKDDGVVMYYIEYILAQIGAIVQDHDLTKAMANDLTMKEYISKGKFDANKNTVTFPKDTVTYVYNTFNTIAKEESAKEENGGFYLLPTTNISDVPASNFKNAQMFRTFRNIVIEKGCLGVATNYYSRLSFIDIFSDPDHPIMLVGNVSHLNAYKDNPEQYVSCTFFCANEWLFHKGAIMQFPEDDQIYTSCSEAEHNINAGVRGYTDVSRMNPGEGNSGNFCFYSTTGERIRVFVSQNAAKNYTVGNRKVYFTENYYNYQPEDLTVSIDDLQKSVDDLQKVIDELLKQIGDNTSEKEIMDLLKQILEELRNQQGGGGGNTGGGDVNIDIDLSTTNGLLSKILAKVTQIFDKLSETAGSAADTVHAKLQETLDEILAQIKKLKHWTIADTLIDGITGLSDIITDWADFIGDILSGADDAAEGAVGAVSATMEDAAQLMKTKFPFCIPWDVYLIVGFLAEEPKTPVFELPIRLESYGIDERIVIDFEDFAVISSLSRTLLTVLYCYGLLNLTMKVFPITKEGGD